MLNYIVINGIKSTMVNGLLIQSLPPISKPLMRTQIEEIDGRDGDIVTPLGFSAYDKTFKIGLYGKCYDVNEVLAYFAQEGTIIFSNEPDKYYKFKQIDQIDLERLLRFKEAEVTLHCQPFKYSAVDGALTLTMGKNMFNPSAIEVDADLTGVEVVPSLGNIIITLSSDYSGFGIETNIQGLEIGENYTISATGGATTGLHEVFVSQTISESESESYSVNFSGNLNDGLTFESEATTCTVIIYVDGLTGETLEASGIQFEQGDQSAFVPYQPIQVVNRGNTNAKPTVTINGSGAVTLSVNGYSAFAIDLTNDDHITLNSELMEAYKDSPDNLKNRLVAGDYKLLTLQAGTNIFSWTGSVSSITVENYSRWI